MSVQPNKQRTAPSLDGIVAVMLTPFTAENRIDWLGLERLIEWYIANGVETLFAVCQSSEMQHLSLAERVELGRRVVAMAAGRVPVIVSGHISDNLDEQKQELTAMADVGADALVLVTNHLDPQDLGSQALRTVLNTVLAWLPVDLPLGLYECPAPYRRLLSDDEFKLCLDTGRFVTLKDVSCDLATVARRVRLAAGSPLSVVNANAAIAADAMRAGSRGFAGVFNNIHPDLYAWLYRHCNQDSALRDDLEVFLALAAMAESMGYPGLAKFWHQRLGTFSHIHSRVTNYDIAARHWAVLRLLDHIEAGSQRLRIRIAQADSEQGSNTK